MHASVGLQVIITFWHCISIIHSCWVWQFAFYTSD